MRISDLLKEENEAAVRRLDAIASYQGKTVRLMLALIVGTLTLLFKDGHNQPARLLPAALLLVACAYAANLGHRKSAARAVVSITEAKLRAWAGGKYPGVPLLDHSQWYGRLRKPAGFALVTRFYKALQGVLLVAVYFFLLLSGANGLNAWAVARYSILAVGTVVPFLLAYEVRSRDKSLRLRLAEAVQDEQYLAGIRKAASRQKEARSDQGEAKAAMVGGRVG